MGNENRWRLKEMSVCEWRIVEGLNWRVGFRGARTEVGLGKEGEDSMVTEGGLMKTSERVGAKDVLNRKRVIGCERITVYDEGRGYVGTKTFRGRGGGVEGL